MGYTHYWRQKRDFTTAEWDKITMRARLIVEAAKAKGICLAHGYGEAGTEPQIDGDEICLNGVGDDAHETFYLTRKQPPFVSYTSIERQKVEGVFGCCKTARKPYDDVVVSIIITAKRCSKGAITISSDGDRNEFKMKFIIAGNLIVPKKSKLPSEPVKTEPEKSVEKPKLLTQNDMEQLLSAAVAVVNHTDKQSVGKLAALLECCGVAGTPTVKAPRKPNRKRCALCGQLCDSALAHQHQGKWVGDECCWDERLRMSE